MMGCLYAKVTPYLTDCVVAELEKLGQKFKIALKIIKDPRFERLPCMHKGTYADDCLVNRVTQVRNFRNLRKTLLHCFNLFRKLKISFLNMF